MNTTDQLINDIIDAVVDECSADFWESHDEDGYHSGYTIDVDGERAEKKLAKILYQWLEK